MMLITIVLLAFIGLESLNVLALYFAPGSRYANAVGVFNAWEKSKHDPEIHAFVRYLVAWVAGVKVMMLLLLAVILVMADEQTQRLSLFALALATASFFWRLFPLIRTMDQAGQITPKHYSRSLGLMILVFIVFFVIAGVV